MSMYNTHNGIFKICVPWNTYMSICALELSSLEFEILSCIDVENWHIENSHFFFVNDTYSIITIYCQDKNVFLSVAHYFSNVRMHSIFVQMESNVKDVLLLFDVIMFKGDRFINYILISKLPF